MKFFKTYELFDSDDLRAKHELDYLSGKLNPEELSQDGPQIFDTVALNDAIIKELPFFSYGNPLTLDDHIAYEFKHDDIRFVIGISSEMMDEGKYPTVVKLLQNDKEHKNASGVFTFEELINQLSKFQKELEEKVTKVNPLNN